MTRRHRAGHRRLPRDNVQGAPPARGPGSSRLLVAALVLFAISLNPWAVQSLFSLWQGTAPQWLPWAVGAVDLGVLATALWILRSGPRLSLRAGRLVPLALAAVSLLALYPNAIHLGLAPLPTVDLEEAVAEMIESEMLLQEAGPDLRKLSRSVLNLEFPDHLSRALFADRVRITDVASGSGGKFRPVAASLDFMSRTWSLTSRTREVQASELRMWQSLLEEVEYFDHARFYFVDAGFRDRAHRQWQAKVGFKGLARMKSGRWSSIKGRMKVLWRKPPAGGGGFDAWKIHEWRLEEIGAMETNTIPWRDVLDQSIIDTAALERARTSVHEILVTDLIFDRQLPARERNFLAPHENFQPMSQDRHPGVAVVDIDGDGLDDLYVMERWGRNLLFRNLGDGRFEEIAERVGLDIRDHCSSAIFADFDNDGDPDVFIGRTLSRSLYLVNENGRFVDRSRQLIDVALPYLVSAASAADYNGDGLLDLYVCTYAFDMMRDMGKPSSGSLTQAVSNRTQATGASGSPLKDFLSTEDAREHEAHLASPEYHGLRNDFGPPNLLLRNIGGGRFVEATDVPELHVFRHTFQAGWADYDNDGDLDIYLANDFAPNNLFRNEGVDGFTDVTEETGTADIGFGMGVSWGDFDHDGYQDLYISNMYSKAGRRITGKIPGLNPIFASMSRGNTLFRNLGTRFEKVSDTDRSGMHVEAAGWSWGSQFADLDNDGWLDIYSLSGFYTAPAVVESNVDL